MAIVNAIKVRTATILAAEGALPPVLSSGSVVGPDRSKALFDAAYRDHGNRIARVLASPTDDEASVG